MRYTIVQSLWTKPLVGSKRLKDTLRIAALSLAYAHKSGYKVSMHTDSYGAMLLKDFGYDSMHLTLDKIPDSVPFELFAAGKFFALREEGCGSVHCDLDVFIEQNGLLDKFFEDNRIDIVCQQDEDYDVVCDYTRKISAMHILGYPPTTRPNWKGSINVGVIGINNEVLFEKYINNYFEALGIYTQQLFDKYKKENENYDLCFDFILEQVTLSYMSIGYNVMTLVPSREANEVSKKIGYAHFMGNTKYSQSFLERLNVVLEELDEGLFRTVSEMTKSL